MLSASWEKSGYIHQLLQKYFSYLARYAFLTSENSTQELKFEYQAECILKDMLRDFYALPYLVQNSYTTTYPDLKRKD